MNNNGNKTNLGEFLSLLIGSKEVGLVIAKGGNELPLLAAELERNGFLSAKNLGDLLKTGKSYYLADQNLDKEVYDFVVQYPSGQVETFDKYVAQPQVFSPDYKTCAVVLLVEEGDLAKLQEKGFNLLAVTGPAFRF